MVSFDSFCEFQTYFHLLSYVNSMFFQHRCPVPRMLRHRRVVSPQKTAVSPRLEAQSWNGLMGCNPLSDPPMIEAKSGARSSRWVSFEKREGQRLRKI